MFADFSCWVWLFEVKCLSRCVITCASSLFCLKIANMTSLPIKYRLFPAPISREPIKNKSSSNEVMMSPHCTPCETASHMEARNVEAGSHRHHSWPGMPKYKTWLKRREGRKWGKKLGFVLWRAARLPTCWSPQTRFLLNICIIYRYLHNRLLWILKNIWVDWFFIDSSSHVCDDTTILSAELWPSNRSHDSVQHISIPICSFAYWDIQVIF